MSAHEWKEYAASYALGALDADDRAAFEAHLADCPSCREDLDAYREAAASMAHAVPDRAPPPSLRTRILEDASALRPMPRRPPMIGVTPRVERRPSVSIMPWLFAAASLALAIASLVLYGASRSRAGSLEETLASTRQQLTERAQQIASLDAAVAARDSLLETALDPAASTATLVASGRPPAVRLFRNARQRRLVIAAAALPPAPAGRTYQLWGLGSSAAGPVSLGTFDTGADGRAVIALPLDPALRFTASAITEEPAGGSPAPTTRPFLTGSWSQ